MSTFSSSVPAVYRHKIIRKNRSDPFGYLYSLLFNLRRTDSPQLRERQLSLVKSIVFSSFRPILRLLGPGRESWKFSKVRYFTRFMYSYRLPSFTGQRRSRSSRYSKTFRSKQNVKRFYYYFRERQLRLFIKRSASGHDEGQKENLVAQVTKYSRPFSSRYYRVIKALEYRLSSVLLRSRFFISPFQIRQAIVHGHVFVNNRCVTAPHQVLSSGDRVTFSKSILGRLKANVVFYLRLFRWLKSPRGYFKRTVGLAYPPSLDSMESIGFDHRLFTFVKKRFKGFKRRLRKPFVPYHLQIDYGLFSISIVDPLRFGTLYFPTRRTSGSSSFRQFLGFYGI